MGRLAAAAVLLAGFLLPCEATLPACPAGGGERGATAETVGSPMAIGHLHSHPHRAAPHHHHAAVGTVTPRLAPPGNAVVAPTDLPADPRSRVSSPAAREVPSRHDPTPPLPVLLCTLLS